HLSPTHMHQKRHTPLSLLSLHDALPILKWRDARHPESALGETRHTSRCGTRTRPARSSPARNACASPPAAPAAPPTPALASPSRSEEHTSELQSHLNLVCRLLLEKKNSP